MAERLGHWTGNLEAPSLDPTRPLVGFVWVGRSSTSGLWPVRIRSPVKFDLNYLFQAITWPH